MPPIWEEIDSELFFISGEHGDGLVRWTDLATIISGNKAAYSRVEVLNI